MAGFEPRSEPIPQMDPYGRGKMADSMKDQSEKIKKAGTEAPKEEEKEKKVAEPKEKTPQEMQQDPKAVLDPNDDKMVEKENYWQDLQYVTDQTGKAAEGVDDETEKKD